MNTPNESIAEKQTQELQRLWERVSEPGGAEVGVDYEQGVFTLLQMNDHGNWQVVREGSHDRMMGFLEGWLAALETVGAV